MTWNMSARGFPNSPEIKLNLGNTGTVLYANVKVFRFLDSMLELVLQYKTEKNTKQMLNWLMKQTSSNPFVISKYWDSSM